MKKPLNIYFIISPLAPRMYTNYPNKVNFFCMKLTSHTVPKRYGENAILRGIHSSCSIMFSTTFHVISRKFGLLFGQCMRALNFFYAHHGLQYYKTMCYITLDCKVCLSYIFRNLNLGPILENKKKRWSKSA